MLRDRFAALSAWLAVVLLTLAAPAAVADDFLPPEQAYRYTVRTTANTLEVTWDVTKGYYLYRKRMGFESATPGVQLGQAVFPTGLQHEDEFFGKQEIYRGRNVFRVPYTVTGARPASLDLKLKLQGCADAGLCYPPTTWTTKVALPAAAAAAGTTGGAGSGGAGGNAVAASSSTPASGGGATGGALAGLVAATADDEFLPPEEAFLISAESAGPDRLRVRFEIVDGYYLYRHRMGVKTDDTRLTVGEPEFPPGTPYEDEFFGEQEIYRQQVEATVPFTRTSGAAGTYQINVAYQGCADAGLCYPPQTRLVSVSLPGGPATGGDGGAAGGTSAGAGAAGVLGAASGATAPASPYSLVALLAFAVFGGLLLNLMPCVLPVLSIKAVSLASSSSANPATARASGYAYTVGVVASMLVLAGALLALRAAGEQIGWGFQLQSPGFVLALTYLLLLVGLNLSGVFEVGTSLAGAGDSLTQGDGLRASFFTGVLTTLVATPCTAPFMATAVGVALTQSAATALAVFAALGLGLALPYLVLALAPRARRFLPKPGAWMHRFKQALAFPMYATAGWLLWLVARQTSDTFLAAAIAGLVLVALAAWCYEQGKTTRGGWRLANAAVALAALAIAVALPAGVRDSGAAQAADGKTAAAQAEEGPWRAFAPGRVDELVATGRPVFVVFTADWCVTCKVNERVALDTDEAMQLFQAKGVELVKADWTNQDAAVSAELAKHGRAGVPLYVFYRPGAPQPEILPQILTPGTVRQLIGALPDREAGGTRA